MWAEAEWRAKGYDIDVHLRDLVTGKTGIWHDTGYPTEEGDEFNEFLWSEGNFACDCNRVDCLYGHDSPEAADNDSFCCTTRRIVIDKIVRASDGKILYEEEAD